MAGFNQQYSTYETSVQHNVLPKQPPVWKPNPDMFTGNISQQRARIRQAKVESVEAVRQALSCIDPALLPAPPTVQPTVQPPAPPPASNTKKRVFIDLTGDDDNSEVIITSGPPQQERTRDSKRPRKQWQMDHSVPEWYVPAAPTAEHSAVHPGDLPKTLMAKGKHDVRERHAKASSRALAKRHLANTAASRGLKHQEPARLTGPNESVPETEKESPPSGLPLNDPVDEEELEAILLGQDSEGGQAEEQEQCEREPIYQSTAGEWLDIYDEELETERRKKEETRMGKSVKRN